VPKRRLPSIEALTPLFAPILSFTTEEVWKNLGKSDSVHLAYFPEPETLTAGISAEVRQKLENWNRLMEVREFVLKSLDSARQEKLIGAPLKHTCNLPRMPRCCRC
jgi:isoleucyl-tRNA synthetase